VLEWPQPEALARVAANIASGDLRPAKQSSGVNLHGSNPKPLMSALGQKQTSDCRLSMSAIPPKADIS
jgi:hypothetical protein